ncbi:MAG: GNAT family N-acetyltransferase [Candidatus Dormibacteria bacterium]
MPVEDILPLRARILRAGRPVESARSLQDGLAATRHLAAFTASGGLGGCVTYFWEDTSLAAGRRALRFRGMAVDDPLQGLGIGRALMRELVARARGMGAQVLWANGRDGALGFYERIGFRVAGDGFLDSEMRLPHHVLIADVDSIVA